MQTEMTVAVARARSWCALGVAVTATAKAGSDGADGGSGHGGGKSWELRDTVAATRVFLGRRNMK